LWKQKKIRKASDGQPILPVENFQFKCLVFLKKLGECRINFWVFLKFMSGRVLNNCICCPQVLHPKNIFKSTTLRERMYTVVIFQKFCAFRNLLCYLVNIYFVISSDVMIKPEVCDR
jgi:hypothetical protein